MTDQEKPGFYAVIPADVRYCTTIPDGAKLLYGEITALCNDRGFCWATNAYFSNLYNCSADTISRWVKFLFDAGFLEVEIDKSKGNQRRIYLAGAIRKNADTLPAETPIPIRKNAEQNNTSNTYNEKVKVNSAFAPDSTNTLKTEKEKKSPPIPAAPPAPVFNPDGWQHPEDAVRAVNTWLDHKRREKKGRYKTQESFDIACRQWHRMAGGDGKYLMEIVEYCIAQDWSGLYKPKGSAAKNGSSQPARATGIRAWDNDRPELKMKQPF